MWVGDDPYFAPGSYTVATQVRDNTNWITQVDFAPVTGRYVRYVAYGAYGSRPTTRPSTSSSCGAGRQRQTITFTSSAPTDAVVGGSTYAVIATGHLRAARHLRDRPGERGRLLARLPATS